MVMQAPVYGTVDKDEANRHSEYQFDTIQAEMNGSVSSLPKPQTREEHISRHMSRE